MLRPFDLILNKAVHLITLSRHSSELNYFLTYSVFSACGRTWVEALHRSAPSVGSPLKWLTSSSAHPCSSFNSN